MSLGGILVAVGMFLGVIYLWLVQVGWRLRAEQIQRDAAADRDQRAEYEAEYLARRDADRARRLSTLQDD